MSMPPWAEAMNTDFPEARSTRIARYISFAPERSIPCSIRRRRTTRPSGPVWCVLRVMPSIAFAIASHSARLFASFTPPPLPRPPAWIWAFTTTGKPRPLAASTASSTV